MIISHIEVEPYVRGEYRVKWRETVGGARVELKRLMGGEPVPVLLSCTSYRERSEVFEDYGAAARFAETLKDVGQLQ